MTPLATTTVTVTFKDGTTAGYPATNKFYWGPFLRIEFRGGGQVYTTLITADAIKTATWSEPA